MKTLLINAIAAVVEKVTDSIVERAAEKAARSEMHDFCEKRGYYVTPIMDAEAISFMDTLKRYTKEGVRPRIEYKTFPVTIERDRRRARTNWVTSVTDGTPVITVHSGEVDF